MQITKKDTSVTFRVYGKRALFTDPITRIGGEKSSYPVPTYEAMIGICKSIYWKPTIIWYIDKVRVINPLKTESIGVKPLKWNGGNDISIYTYLKDVEYEVEAHFEWNMHRPEMEADRNLNKHLSILLRSLNQGGRGDIFLGTRECQGYIERIQFGVKKGEYDNVPSIEFGNMYHGYDYPGETGKSQLWRRFWDAKLINGVLNFPSPYDSGIVKEFVRPMTDKLFISNADTHEKDFYNDMEGV